MCNQLESLWSKPKNLANGIIIHPNSQWKYHIFPRPGSCFGILEASDWRFPANILEFDQEKTELEYLCFSDFLKKYLVLVEFPLWILCGKFNWPTIFNQSKYTWLGYILPLYGSWSRIFGALQHACALINDLSRVFQGCIHGLCLYYYISPVITMRMGDSCSRVILSDPNTLQMRDTLNDSVQYITSLLVYVINILGIWFPVGPFLQ